jgi:DNA-binding Lrp family transcriptional regulator
MLAFVHICTEIGKEAGIAARLRKLPQVAEVRGALGECDLIARLKGENIDEIEKVVMKKIRTLDGITQTKTIITFDV